jgi:hypothetical protein
VTVVARGGGRTAEEPDEGFLGIAVAIEVSGIVPAVGLRGGRGRLGRLGKRHEDDG